ncbi:hypothetical protein TWF696_009087 [Orbilia brochopaga]|uniref:Thioesterase domain-containing protein n=1 Tax=Orbilia brochopaga TaxID=3140254 RepID=A0AAV9UGG4_9PEZI
MQPLRRLIFSPSSSFRCCFCSSASKQTLRRPHAVPTRRTGPSRIQPLHTSARRPFAASQIVAMSDDGSDARPAPAATNGPSELDQTLLSRLKDTPLRQPETIIGPDDEGGPPTTWGRTIYSTLNPIKASLYPYPTATYTFYVEPRYANLSGNLHGGAAATIFDVATTMTLALVQKPEFWEYWGVTRTLSCSYLRPVQSNKYVTIQCEIVGLGKRLVHIKGTMKDKEGRVLITCEHDKVNIDSKIAPRL